MRRSLLLLVLGLVLGPVLGPVLTACGDHASTSPRGSGSPTSSVDVMPACCAARRDAHVSGVLIGIGGPVATAVQHWAGMVHVSGRTFASVRTDARGHFSLALPAGTYRFSATSPSYDDGHAECRARDAVRLRADRTTHVRVVCELK